MKRQLSGRSEATNFVETKWPRGPWPPSGQHQEQKDFSTQQHSLAVLSRSDQKNEKAVRQQDGLLFQGRIVPTELKKDHQNFLAKSYWASKGSVKEFFDNKCFCFQ